MLKSLIVLTCLCISGCFVKLAAQQEDLLSSVYVDSSGKEYVKYAFKSSRVIMSHSLEILDPGVMDLRILHRFGSVNGGFHELFGLDNATMRMGFDFGISRNLMIGIGRSSNNKELDGYAKYRLISQVKGKGGLPLSFLLAGGATLSTARNSDSAFKFPHRISYFGQGIIGAKLSEKLSLQLMPSIIHQNLVASVQLPNDLFALGIGGRLKLSNRVAFTFDYYFRNSGKNYSGVAKTYNPLSIGFDIETGGHIFQLHFTNAFGMNEKEFLTATTSSWGSGGIHFGFNLSRTFQIRKRNTN